MNHVLNSFFVVRGVRKIGVGLLAVHEVVTRHPGPREVAFQDDNVAAVRFWRRVATEIAGGALAEECRPIPSRPDLRVGVRLMINDDAGERDVRGHEEDIFEFAGAAWQVTTVFEPNLATRSHVATLSLKE